MYANYFLLISKLISFYPFYPKHMMYLRLVEMGFIS